MMTVNTVSEVTGIDAQMIRNWISSGSITPAAVGGVGRGRDHRFSAMQAVGLAVAEQIRQSEQGCVHAYVVAVVKAFESVSEEWLLRQFADGRLYLACVHQGTPMMATKKYDWPNVLEMYQAVKARNGREGG